MILDETFPVYTDPAQELGALVSWLESQPASELTAAMVFAGAAGLNTYEPAFYEALAAINRRIARLTVIVTELLATSRISERSGRMITEANIRLNAVFHPETLQRPWSEVLGTIDSDLAATFDLASPSIRPFATHRLISDVERERILAELEQDAAKLKEATGVKTWQDLALELGLQQLRTMIFAFRFFGHDAVGSAAIHIAALTEAARRPPGDFGDRDDRNSALDSIKKTVGVIVYSVGLFALPDVALTSAGHYRQLILGGDPYGLVAPVAPANPQLPSATPK